MRYSGSKRNLRKYVVSFFPKDCDTYYEPFCGGCSILYTVVEEDLFKKYCASDLYKPLIDTLLCVKNNPQELLRNYVFKWHRLLQNREYYYDVRKHFNENNNPNDFFFLSRTCINGLMRFNPKGYFNSAIHLGRNGITPKMLKKTIRDWYIKLQCVNISCCDFEVLKENIHANDFVYLDPPYYINTGFYYYKELKINRLVDFLFFLNTKGTKWCLSYNNDEVIPQSVYKRKIGNQLAKNVFRKFQMDFSETTDFLFMNY
uniref:site-specific DNA-methyltransferase (adenine-specific) n=1 Tax=viral metagenome TaxID=1070528 RepID=A0A6M3MB12_9ZZZZ